MKLKKINKEELLQAARGEIQSDLVVTNAQLVNVVTGEVYLADVFVKDGHVVHVEHIHPGTELDKAKQVYDAKGQYLTPGFIDAHVHIESSMLTPRNFAKAVAPWGTTTVITDPHEIANVLGTKGVHYMHESSEGLPIRELIDIPSCVPSVPGLEYAGADFESREIEELSLLPRVIGLAEVMDFLAVIQGEKRMMDILKVAEKKNLYIQGHAPSLSGRNLSAYTLGGPKTCHETRGSSEALDKMRVGMFVDARESSITKNMKSIWEGVNHCRYYDHLCLCTDDRESDDILNNGHMNEVIRVAIKEGMHPIDAIRSATYNTAREIKADDLGIVAPGYIADMVLMPNLEEVVPSAVFFEGKLIAEDRKLLVEIEDKSYAIESENSVNVKELSVDDFIIKAPIQEGKVTCQVMEYVTTSFSISKLAEVDIPVKDGKLDLSFDTNLKFVAVVNRYDKDNIALHIVKNFGTTHGALASTVSHDSHNLTIVYDTPENALVAAEQLKSVGGGMVAVEEGKILATLELKLAGLISVQPAEKLAKEAEIMKQANRQLGLVEIENPLLRIVTLALPVIPEVKMSDLGLVDVMKKELIPLFKG
ncbi:MAG: adenine deaminase [Anaerorhabdus sp.]